MEKIMLCFGTRPEAIKMCPLIIALKKTNLFNIVVCVTGQHKEMLQSALDIFGIVPDYNLNIMKPGQTLFDTTSNILEGIQKIMINEKPSMVLVHGDTTSSFASALAAFYLNIPVGHVEAGLRTYNIKEPFPEEFNRQAISLISSINFCPTDLSLNNLKTEKNHSQSVNIVTGNTGIDSLKYTRNLNANSELKKWIGNDKLILLTAHRRENYDHFGDIFTAINDFLKNHTGYKVIYPVHLSPTVRKAAATYFDSNDKVKLIEPLDVVNFHNLISISYIILTDSGGIQEEAPYFGIPVLVLRNTTERPEGVIAGTLKLAGNSYNGVLSSLIEVLDNDEVYKKMSSSKNPFGDGFASERIVSALMQYFNYERN